MTAAVARPAQALRQRRDVPRPSLAKRQTTMDGAIAEPPGKKRKLNEPYVRSSDYILRKHKNKSPSLTIHLHQTYFRFEGQDGSFAYDSPMRFVIEHLKKQTVPHEMIEELLQNNVQFYDGCLIVEVHSHRAKEGREKGKRVAGADDDDDTVKFSMHNYNEHITPSPMVPYPTQARTDRTPEKSDNTSNDMPAPERPKEKEGPTITTIVLHPTELSVYNELLLLAKTPAAEVRNKKRGSETTPSSAQPPTPQLSVPPTPITQTSRGPLSQSQKMCLEDGDLYSFMSDLLVATEPPLYLDPVDNPQDADKVLDLLQHPLHQDKPPSSKTRKRTTAEVAADDAQAAEIERRMLMMDERIKPAGAGNTANENQGAPSSIAFSRFKTIDMVKQKLEDHERAKKEEEARVAMEEKHNKEQNTLQQQKLAQQQQLESRRQAAQAYAQQQAQLQQNPQQNMLVQQRAAQAQLRLQQQQMAQSNSMMNAATQQNHAHPQQNGMVGNQPNFPQGHQGTMTQSSPIARQGTPLMNSSPMVAQNGFAAAHASSQGAGSPQRPTSAAVPPNMVRQLSQQQGSQQQGSRMGTPQMGQGTPSMASVVPNRQVNQTPRMQPGSPAVAMQGTPTSGSMQHMPTPQMMGNQQLTPEQMAMLQQQRNAFANQNSSGAGHAGSPTSNMTPEQIQNINLQAQRFRQQQQATQQAMQQAQAQGNPQMVAHLQAQQQQQQRQMLMMRQRMMQQQQQHQLQQNAQHGGGTPGAAGSPGAMQQGTPQMNHGHPQQQQQMAGQQQQQQGIPKNLPQNMSSEQYLQAANRAQQLANARFQAQAPMQQHLQQLSQQYGGLQNIPQQAISSLQPNMQQLIRQHQARHNQQLVAQQMRSQQQANGNQGGGGNGGGQEQVPGQPNPQFMQSLRDNQAMIARAQQQQMHNNAGVGTPGGGGNQMNTMGGMSFNLPGGQQNGDNLSQQFAAMQNALHRSSSAQGH